MAEEGTLLRERYRIEAILGSGGMGCVYLAQDVETGQQVAIKEMHGSAHGDEHHAGLLQLRNEAAVLCRLQHPRLPKVFDYFEIEYTPHVVMEYIKGRNLSVVAGQEEGPLAIDLVMEWARELCDVLGYLHGQQPPVVFRDLKPGNIMLDVQGHIKLIDFGIAKIFQHNTATATFARGATSPGYTALEQYAGGTGTDARSDIYSLGATLYALLTTRVPPDAVQRAADLSHLVPLRRARPDAPLHLTKAIERMLAMKSVDRPQSIDEVRHMLGFTAALPPAAADPEDPEVEAWEEGPPPPRPWWQWAAIPLVAVGVLVGSWMALKHTDNRPPVPVPSSHPSPMPSPRPHPHRK